MKLGRVLTYSRIVVVVTLGIIFYLMRLIYLEYSSSGAQAEALQARCEADTLWSRQLLQTRREKDTYFASSPQSPVPAEARGIWLPIAYYPPDTAYRVQARYRPLRDGDLRMADGTPQQLAGELSFRLQGRDCRLRAYRDREPVAGVVGLQVYIPFRDSSAGSETYGGGRLLNALIDTAAQTAQLDFNYAYHPFCVYDPRYVCPVPPVENTLPLHLRAGERLRVAPAARMMP